MKNLAVSVFSLLVVMCSCATKSNEEKQTLTTPKNIKTFLIEGTKKFSIDSLTHPSYFSTVQFLDINNKDYFTFFNESNWTVYVYEYQSGTLVKKIPMQKEGPNAVGPYTNVHYFHNSLDSIYVNDATANTFYLLNSNGEVLKKHKPKYTEPKLEDDYLPVQPFFTKESPIIKKGRYIYGASSTFAEYPNEKTGNRPFAWKIDTQTDSIVYTMTFSEAYGSENWGWFYTRDPSMAFNKEKQQLIYSLPIEHCVYIQDINTGKVEKKLAKGAKMKDVQPVDRPKSPDRTFNTDEMLDRLCNIDYYFRVLYDPYQKYTYRFAIRVAKECQGDRHNIDLKDIFEMSIIILDDDYNQVGEYILDMNKHTNGRMFVSKEGLMVGKYSENEDLIEYDILKVVDLNK